MSRTFAGCATLTLLLGIALTPACGVAAESAPAAEYKKAAGPFAVEVATHEWLDAERDRRVPVKIYSPQTGRGPFPVIVFSHGLGGSRDGYEYLGRHWASHGYVSVHLQHLGSDTEVWRGVARPMDAMRRAAADPDNLLNRPRDVSFAIDRLETLNREDKTLAGRLDLDRLGVAGHSFGAYTTLAVAGQVFVLPGGREVSFADPCVKAAIPMSAPVAARSGTLDKAFATIRIPCLHMTGTRDTSPIGKTQAEDRRLPFDHSVGPDKYLVIFTDGDHMIFSGRRRFRGLGTNDAVFHDLIRMSTTAFWDAYLKQDSEAKKWLSGGQFQAVLGQHGTFEQKQKG